MSARAVLDECYIQGVTVKPLADGKIYVDPIANVPDELHARLIANKLEIHAYLQLAIPCQIQWQPSCAGPHSPTTLISPTRSGFKASPDQVAAACDPCRAIMQERNRNQNFDRENYLLWGVFKTQQWRSFQSDVEAS